MNYFAKFQRMFAKKMFHLRLWREAYLRPLPEGKGVRKPTPGPSLKGRE